MAVRPDFGGARQRLIALSEPMALIYNSNWTVILNLAYLIFDLHSSSRLLPPSTHLRSAFCHVRRTHFWLGNQPPFPSRASRGDNG
jgi:hypothetical protein